MKKYNILDVLYNEPSRTPPYIDFEIKVTDDDGNEITLITDATFKDFLRQYYFDFWYMTPSYYNTVTNQHVELAPDVATAAQMLGYHFNQWKADRQHGFLRLYEALMEEYNPIHNYDKTIKSTTDYRGKETDDLTFSGSEQLAQQKGLNETTISKTPYDDTNFIPNTKSSNAMHTDTDTKSFTNRKNTNEKTFTNRQDEYNYHEYGNIGVTTTQQMITSQFPLTDLDALKRYIVNLFVHENLVL